MGKHIILKSLGIISRSMTELDKPKPCFVCGSAEGFNSQEDGGLMPDGRMVHWKCFKCSKCGKAGKPSTRLLSSKCAALLQGTYVCDDCPKDGQRLSVGMEKAPESKKAEFQLVRAAYYGVGNDVKIMIRLEEGGNCSIQCAPNGEEDAALTWMKKGKYKENASEENSNNITSLSVSELVPEDAG